MPCLPTQPRLHVELSPIEWLEKLAALVPPPRVNQVLVHGVLTPRAKWRQEIVPKSSYLEAFKPLRKCATLLNLDPFIGQLLSNSGRTVRSTTPPRDTR